MRSPLDREAKRIVLTVLQPLCYEETRRTFEHQLTAYSAPMPGMLIFINSACYVVEALRFVGPHQLEVKTVELHFSTPEHFSLQVLLFEQAGWKEVLPKLYRPEHTNNLEC